MNGCIYRTADSKCEKFTNNKTTSFCYDEEVSQCEYKKQSNRDRLRDMSNKELAKWIAAQTAKPGQIVREYEFWLDWLEEEAK